MLSPSSPSSTLSKMLLVNNVTSLAISSSYPSAPQRLLIVFGSICSLWIIIGLIFASIQTFRHLKKKTRQKFFRYHRALPVPTGQVSHDDNQSLNSQANDEDDDDDDQASVFTSVSFLSERGKGRHEHMHASLPCERIPEEDFELDLPTPIGVSNLAFSQSTLASSADHGRSLLYYPACRNFAYSQSTLASTDADLRLPVPAPSVVIEPTLVSGKGSSSTRRSRLKRHSSQSSTTTAFSQITNATYLSSSSASTSSSIPTASLKTLLLPTVMITDCDRLQTDIIELDDFEPEKDWRRARRELRVLLNDRMPQAVRWSNLFPMVFIREMNRIKRTYIHSSTKKKRHKGWREKIEPCPKWRSLLMSCRLELITDRSKMLSNLSNQSLSFFHFSSMIEWIDWQTKDPWTTSRDYVKFCSGVTYTHASTGCLWSVNTPSSSSSIALLMRCKIRTQID